MCGIAGFVSSTEMEEDTASRIVTTMTRLLAHRGPDGEGIWIAEGGVAALGHRRLAIIDLSPAGHQPMTSSDGRWVITYNGETYNFVQLRNELEPLGVRFRGASDTEVIVEAIARWGVEATAKKLNGIFAFAVWDRAERTLWLVRDRFGVKPLYWLYQQGEFAFGSELKSIRAFPKWRPEVDVDVLGSYFQFNYIPAPHSIYKNVRKLWPGGILRLPWRQEPVAGRYWDAFEVAGRHIPPEGMDDNEAVDGLEALLKDSIRGQMVSDVPLGALLSGGIDSSSVVALMQAQSSRPIRTFSIGFYAQGFDEARYAAAVAKHLGTQHEELYVDEKLALSVIPHLSTWYDEPYADSSQIPTYLVSSLARQNVTVALSGDGGDELFAGYPRYWRHPSIWYRTRQIPRQLRLGASRIIRSINGKYWTSLMELLPKRLQTISGGGTILRLAAVLPKDDPRVFHRTLVTLWESGAEIVPDALPVETAFDRILPLGLDYGQMMQLLDSSTYMIDDILVKVDRASMATALEVRVPILDHRIYEYSWALPAHMKLRGNISKWVLRNVLYRYVPRHLVDRPKAGFGIPMEMWLRGQLRDWCESLLDERWLREDGFLNVACVRRIWQEHLSGKFNHCDRLWAVLQFQSWLHGRALESTALPLGILDRAPAHV